MNDKYYQQQQVFVCECQSLNHVYSFWIDPTDGMITWSVTLPNHRNLFQRIWRALGYIVGKKARYGDHGGMIISPEDYNKIRAAFDRSEVIAYLLQHPKIEQAAMELWEDPDAVVKWLSGYTVHSMNWGLDKLGQSSTRVMDMSEQEILDEIGRIEHGIF